MRSMNELSNMDTERRERETSQGLATYQYRTPEGFWCSADAGWVVLCLESNIPVRLVS